MGLGRCTRQYVAYFVAVPNVNAIRGPKLSL